MYLEEYKNLETRITGFRIENKDDSLSAVEFMAEIKTFKESVDKERKDKLKPLRDQIKETEQPFKEMLNKIKEVESKLKEKIKEYQLALNKQEQEKKLKEIEIMKQDAEWEKRIYGDQAIPQEVLNAIEKKAHKKEKLTTEKAGSYIQKKWKYEIVDEDAIPRFYCVPSKEKIRRAINNGVRVIPGINVFSEDEIVIRKK